MEEPDGAVKKPEEDEMKNIQDDVTTGCEVCGTKYTALDWPAAPVEEVV